MPTTPDDPIPLARARLSRALVAAGDGDRGAFRTLHRLTSPKLFGICLRICGERQAAEDVMNDVYLTVWQRAGSYQEARASPITWMATIARNRAIDWRRANGRRAAVAMDDIPEPPDLSPLASEAMLDAEAVRRLHACLDALEPPQRDSIRTAFYDGLTYAELADRRGIPLGTVKSWVRRGLMRLRGCLHDDD